MWHTMGDWGWAMMAFGIVFWLAVLGLAVWWIGEWSRGREVAGGRGESAREILDRRLARGEIDLEAYRRSVDAIGRPHGPASG